MLHTWPRPVNKPYKRWKGFVEPIGVLWLLEYSVHFLLRYTANIFIQSLTIIETKQQGLLYSSTGEVSIRFFFTELLGHSNQGSCGVQKEILKTWEFLVASFLTTSSMIVSSLGHFVTSLLGTRNFASHVLRVLLSMASLAWRPARGRH